MKPPFDPPVLPAQQTASHIAAATALIAPTWPLDQFIAVNPYWGWVDTPIAEAAASLGTLAGTRLTMPREWFKEQWTSGRLTRQHIKSAARAEGAQNLLDEIVDSLERKSPALPRLPLVTDLRDAIAPSRPGQSWGSLVTHQISQHCAAFFDRHQAAWKIDKSAGLYASWRENLAADHGLVWRQGRGALKTRLDALPDTPEALIAVALDALAIADDGRTAYLRAVLMAINGWAAWCAYERWQARLADSDDDGNLVHLLAIRLAWEWLLHDDAAPATLAAGWAARWSTAAEATRTLQAEQRVDWVLQRAVELAWQQPLIAGLCKAQRPPAIQAPAVQAVFCIDVRSEVFRRALESAGTAVQTIGFAGFFGLPVSYSPIGSALTRPQLPGLLQPSQCVTDSATGDAGAALGQVLAKRRRNALQWRQRWAEFRAAPASAFSFVESMGLLYGAKLVADSLPSTAMPARWEDTGLSAQAALELRPRLPQVTEDPAAAAAMVKNILTAMGLVRDFAPLVLLAGHGSQSANNPHAAGLDCGACGGQTGEVNARALADLINNPLVRQHLNLLGIDLPVSTHFLPALHNTTTDQFVLFDTADVPEGLQPRLEQLRGWLHSAGQRARAERAAGLGLGHLSGQPGVLKQALFERANDWAQVRPEWGLADNAAFIVAPRRRSQHLDLKGRSFLHDYDWQLDPDLSVLTLIMTAPMVVTHWINMQYHASTVDNLRYGSGNKMLHNVVGGHIGVFEGNGGDLRIGLPQQSLHDGHHLRHTPLRLSVFIEAPRKSIDAVINDHELVRHLVGHGWLHLFRIDPEDSRVEQHREGGWVTVPDPA